MGRIVLICILYHTTFIDIKKIPNEENIVLVVINHNKPHTIIQINNLYIDNTLLHGIYTYKVYNHGTILTPSRRPGFPLSPK